MAHLVPSDAFDRGMDPRHPELVVVRRLAEALDDDWWVLHHRVFGVAEPLPDRPETITEIDVLVLHPDRGVLILEVKGGRIECDNGTLYRVKHGRREKLRPQPFSQVVAQRDNLIKHLQSVAPEVVERGDWRKWVTWAIAFPGTKRSRDESFMPVNSSPARILWEDVFREGARSALEDAVCAAFALDPLGPSQRGRTDWQEHVRRATSDGDFTKEPLGQQLRTVDADLTYLTHAQSAVLNQLADEKRVLITGPAGSGKTVLAWEKAARLAAAGRKVLLVAYDPRAVGTFQHASADPNITAQTVEDLCLWVAGGHDMVDGEDFKAHDPFWFGRSLPDALEVHATGLTDDERFDDLIVDEVFDMWPRVLGALRSLLRDERSASVWLFGDSRQGVTWPAAVPLNPEAAHHWDEIPPYATFQEGDCWGDGTAFVVQRLFLNCRNARPIQQILAGRFFGDGSASLEDASRAVPSPSVVVDSWMTGADLRSKVVAAVARLIAGGVEPNEIAVLHGADMRASQLYEVISDALDQPRLIPELPDQVEVSSVASFKGADRQAILLCEMEAVAASRAQAHWYTGISRARTHLILLTRATDAAEVSRIDQVLKRARREAGDRIAPLGLAVNDVWPIP